MQTLLSCMTALSFACLNGTQCHNELKGLLILNLITLLCPSAAFTLIAFLWFSTFCFLINHLLIRALLFYTCPCHSSLKRCPFTKLLHRLNLFFQLFSWLMASVFVIQPPVPLEIGSPSLSELGKFQIKNARTRDQPAKPKPDKTVCFDWSI